MAPISPDAYGSTRTALYSSGGTSLVSAPSNIDTNATATAGVLETFSIGAALNASGTFDRLRTAAATTAATGSGILAVGIVAGPIGLPNFSPGQVSITTAATLIAAARTGAPGTGRSTVTIVNNSANAVTIGGSGVTTTTGVTIPASGTLTLQTTAAIYGVAGSASTVSYYELY